jgi:hypothetical protein
VPAQKAKGKTRNLIFTTLPKIAHVHPFSLTLYYYLKYLLSLFNSYIYISIGVGEGGRGRGWEGEQVKVKSEKRQVESEKCASRLVSREEKEAL